MKKLLISTLMTVFVCGPVFAQSSKDGTQGRTRAEVKEELAKSKHEGTQTIKNSEYPPGEQTVKRAQSEHAAQKHPNEGTKPEFDEHDKAGKPKGQGGR
ncbi:MULTISPECIES: DUF4148 domain-containing protein [Cupriavidus]|uniref:DUF4148 domain-containing protein n=1 Tax=Cupriavidus pinatubonensis TaxID=248026 RepID=A0ABN7XYK8_9BURK|nr:MULTISPECIES: DUF4148 domain-containing protein [Cupriavidus]CAG9166193.1 hypothetical protein LMG23994_00923 [Cupriavidus pinatubonensis]